MSLSAALFLAPGFEEIEAITTIDILRRAGLSVTSVGIISGPLVASRKTVHLADCLLEEVEEKTWDLIVLPGGVEGVENLKKDHRVASLVKRHHLSGKWIAAICAAPTLLAEWNLLGESLYTCHPSVQKTMSGSGLRGNQRVVVSGKLITSMAAGSSLEFSYEIVRQLFGEETLRSVELGVCALH